MGITARKGLGIITEIRGSLVGELWWGAPFPGLRAGDKSDHEGFVWAPPSGPGPFRISQGYEGEGVIRK